MHRPVRISVCAVYAVAALILAHLGPAGAVFSTQGAITYAQPVSFPLEGRLGSAVCIANDTLIVSAPSAPIGGTGEVGSAEWVSNDWILENLLTAQPETLLDEVKTTPYVQSLALINDVAAVGSPQDPYPGAFEVLNAVGAVEVFIKVYPDPSSTDFTFVWNAILTLGANAVVNDHFGLSVALAGLYLVAGSKDRDLYNQNQLGVAAVWSFAGGIFQPWTPEGVFMRANAIELDEFGQSVACTEGGYMAISSPTANVRTGSVFIYVRQSHGTWVLNQTLTAPGSPILGDSFGAAIAMLGHLLIVSAPSYAYTGNIFGWTLDANGSAYVPTLTLRPADSQPLAVGFGTSISLSDSFIISGTPLFNGAFGAVYAYNGYEYFPLKAPVMWIPRDGIAGNPLVLLEDGLSFLINEPFIVYVLARFSREITVATYDGTIPDPFLETGTVDPYTGEVAPGGGVFYVPAIPGPINYTLQAVSYYVPDTLTSPITERTILINVAAPGLWWTDNRLEPCGEAIYYCPGVFTDVHRYLVLDAYYSTPENVSVELRSSQQPCEPDRFCEAGLAHYCGLPVCWPVPVAMVAREALPGEVGADGTNYYLSRAPGLGVGDVIQVYFNQNTTEPEMNSTALVLSLLQFNTPFGQDGYQLSGKWASASELLVTVVSGYWTTPGVTDSYITRIGNLAARMLVTGDVRREGNTTLPGYSENYTVLSGTWGAFSAPAITTAQAFGGPFPLNGSGPATSDSLILTFNVPLQPFPVPNESAVLDLLIFTPPLQNVSFAASWSSWFQLSISFTGVTAPFYPNLYNFKLGIGNLQVGINPAASLRSRDGGSPTAITTPLFLTGDWGDIPQDLVLSLNTPTQLGVYWTNPSSRSLPPTQYVCQLSKVPEFTGPLASIQEMVISGSNIIHFNKLIYPYAYDNEYEWIINGLGGGVTYWIRCAAYLEGGYGPWCPSIPPSIDTDKPQVLSVSPLTTDISTRGAVVNMGIRNLGWGRHVSALSVGAKYRNLNHTYVAQNCFVGWNGSFLQCQAVAGVGLAYQWTMFLSGFPGYASPPSAVTNYLPPVLYDIFSEFNNTLTSPSAGNEVFNITGDNFGPAAANVLWWVHYTPVDHPAIIFNAHCQIIVDHVVLRCVTGPQAGNHLYWTVNVAGAISEVPYTSTRPPNVTSAVVLFTGDGLGTDVNGNETGAVPLQNASALFSNSSFHGAARSADGVSLSTSGGGVVVLTGTDFGPGWSDVPISVTFTPAGAPSAVFVCPACVVTSPHVEITCWVPEAYGSNLRWTVAVLDQVSPPYTSNLTFGVPVLTPLPPPSPALDLFSNNSYPFTSYNSLPTTVSHQRLNRLNPFAYVPTSVTQHYVTDCDPVADLSRLIILTSAYPAISLPDALEANATYVSFLGYSGGSVGYSGGNLFFLVDRAQARGSGPCSLWPELMVGVDTDAHWVAFTGDNFASANNASAGVYGIVDGVLLPLGSVRVRDDKLVEVLVPAALGRRRLQLQVNGVRSNGVILVNLAPVVHGYMEWRLGMEDVRGRSPASENNWQPNLADGDPGWGGFGAWISSDKCMQIEIVGHHFGSDADVAAGRVLTTVNGRPCEFLINVRHHRMTCCSRYPNATVVVAVAGLSGTSVFSPPLLTRKPVVLSYSPETVASDGINTVTITGGYFLTASNGSAVLFTTDVAEPLIPTGYENLVGGNYDDLPLLRSNPTPTPVPDPPISYDQIQLEGLSEEEAQTECVWRTFWPVINEGRMYPAVTKFTDTVVEVTSPRNHAVGMWLRVAVPSPVDRAVLYTERYFLAFFTPTVVEIYPPALPLSGGVVNLIGFSFGSGGKVYVRQHTASLPDFAMYQSPGEVGPELNTSSLFVYTECLLLIYNQSHIRCLAPPGYDPTAALVIDLGWAVTVWPGLVYKADFLCSYNTTYDVDTVDVVVETLFERYRLALWCGFAFGFGLWFGIIALFMKAYNHGPRDVFQPGPAKSAAEKAKDAAARTAEAAWESKANEGTGGTTGRRSSMATSTYGDTTTMDASGDGDGSFITSDYGSKAGKTAPGGSEEDGVSSSPSGKGGKGGKKKRRRNTNDIVMAKQAALIDSVEEDDDLTKFLKEKGLLTGTWKKKERRGSNASFEEMVARVQAEADARLAEKVKKEEDKAYRRKHNLDRHGNKILKGKWWQCCCCRYKPPPPPPEEEEPSDDDADLEAELTPRARAQLAKAKIMYMDALGYLPGEERPTTAGEEGEEESKGAPVPPSNVESPSVAASVPTIVEQSIVTVGEEKEDASMEDKVKGEGDEVGDSDSDGSRFRASDSDASGDLEDIFAKKKSAIMGRREVNKLGPGRPRGGAGMAEPAVGGAAPARVGPPLPSDHPVPKGVFGVSDGLQIGGKAKVPAILRNAPWLDSDSD